MIAPKIAAVERREARLPVTRQAGAFVEVPYVICAVPALRSLVRGRRKRKAAPRATPRKGPMKHA